jgi:hypothetical protein
MQPARQKQLSVAFGSSTCVQRTQEQEIKGRLGGILARGHKDAWEGGVEWGSSPKSVLLLNPPTQRAPDRRQPPCWPPEMALSFIKTAL